MSKKLKTMRMNNMFTVFLDFEYIQKDGELPQPLCYVAKLSNGKIIRHWISGKEKAPLYPTDNNALFIGFYINSEILCHLVLGYPMPKGVIDLYTEFRNLTNGNNIYRKVSLLNACEHYGIRTMSNADKERMRARILQGPPFSKQERGEILDYCEQDVLVTEKLFNAMKLIIKREFPYALKRGQYMSAVAQMEYYGIPINGQLYKKIYDNRDLIKHRFIAEVNPMYHVYINDKFSFKAFEGYLKKNNMLDEWPLTYCGRLSTSLDDLEDLVKVYPKLQKLLEVKQNLGKLRLLDLLIGKDGRARTSICPFTSETGRNQPSSAHYIFGNSKWARNLIKPSKGMALAYIDYEQQEIAIAAALSGDKALKHAYETGDPYLQLGKVLKLIPKGGTKQSHKVERDLCKQLMLAVNYGMQIETFANITHIPLKKAEVLIGKHILKFSTYWNFINAFSNDIESNPRKQTKFHWQCDMSNKDARFLLNWPMQSHGSEILRTAIVLCLEHGIKVCGPIHDAILIEAPINKINGAVEIAEKCMIEASKQVLGYPIRVAHEIIKYPGHFESDKEMWNKIIKIIGK